MADTFPHIKAMVVPEQRTAKRQEIAKLWWLARLRSAKESQAL
jgi:hypothetical protein